MNSSEVIANVTETIRTKPLPIWGQVMDLGDYPHNYFTTFGAMVCNIYSFILPGFILKGVIGLFARVILPKDMREWLMEEYLPQIIKSTKNNKIPILKRQSIFMKFFGLSIKMFFAFSF